MLICYIDSAKIESAKKYLSSNFDMKDLYFANVILSIRIIGNYNGIILTQSHYNEEIMKNLGRYDWKPTATRIDSNLKLFPNTRRVVDLLEYARGCLMYIMTYTKLDITVVVDKLSRYTSNPSHIHYKIV